MPTPPPLLPKRSPEPPETHEGHGEQVYCARFCTAHYQQHLDWGGVVNRFKRMNGTMRSRIDMGCDFKDCVNIPSYREIGLASVRKLAQGACNG